MLGNKQIIFFTFASTLFISSIAGNSIFQTAFAQSQTTPGFTVLTGEQLKNNPFATNILDRIEQSKILLAQLLSDKEPMTEHQKFIEEQRTIAKERLNADLARMNKQYENLPQELHLEAFFQELTEHIIISIGTSLTILITKFRLHGVR